jgi:NADH-quinone oxidoreductase subunit L
MTRLMVLTFWSNERFQEKDNHKDEEHQTDDHHSPAHDHHGGTPHDTPRVMTTPLIVLAIGAALVGFLGMPSAFGVRNYFEHFLEPSIAKIAPATAHSEISSSSTPTEHSTPAPTTYINEDQVTVHEDHTTEFILMGVSVLIAAAGIGIGWSWFNKNPLWSPPRLLEDKYRVDEAYNATIIQPIKQGSTNILWKFIDVKIIDGLVNGAATFANSIGGALRYLQSGLARSYVAMVVIGALLIIGYFILRIR